MAIRAMSGPADGGDVISEALAPLVEQPGENGSSLASVRAADGALVVDLELPHPVFMVGLEDVADGCLLSRAREEAWRYLLVRGDVVVGTATVEDEEDKLTFSHLARGPYVGSIREAMLKAAELPQIEAHDFDVRLLEIPLLSLRTLWLTREGEDLLIPLEPAPSPIRPYQMYTENEILDHVRDWARSALEEAARPREVRV